MKVYILLILCACSSTPEVAKRFAKGDCIKYTKYPCTYPAMIKNYYKDDYSVQAYYKDREIGCPRTFVLNDEQILAIVECPVDF